MKEFFSDEELAIMENGKDVKHDADFIAGSDRGKALAVTMNADSMRSTISVEVLILCRSNIWITVNLSRKHL